MCVCVCVRACVRVKESVCACVHVMYVYVCMCTRLQPCLPVCGYVSLAVIRFCAEHVFVTEGKVLVTTQIEIYID